MCVCVCGRHKRDGRWLGLVTMYRKLVSLGCTLLKNPSSKAVKNKPEREGERGTESGEVVSRFSIQVKQEVFSDRVALDNQAMAGS